MIYTATTVRTKPIKNLYFVILVNQIDQILNLPEGISIWDIYDKRSSCYFFIHFGKSYFSDRAFLGSSRLLNKEKIINMSEYILKLCN